VFKAYFAPGLVGAFGRLVTTAQTSWALLPPISFTLQRRLFPGVNTFSVFECSTEGGLPTFSLSLTSQKRLDLGIEEEERTPEGPPTRSGLALCVGHWSIGASIPGVLPVVFAQCGVVFAELGLQLQTKLERSLQTWSCSFSAIWNTQPNASLSKVGAEVGVGSGGISLKLA
jgi:DnaJ homolog subfamily C member 11